MIVYIYNLHCLAHSTEGLLVVVEASAVVVSAAAKASRAERARMLNFIVDENKRLTQKIFVV